MKKLVQNEEQLDDKSKKALQKKGLSSQEIAGYRFYSNDMLRANGLTHLFEKIRKVKQPFRKVLAKELDDFSEDESTKSESPSDIEQPSSEDYLDIGKEIA